MANMLLKRIKDWETSINSFRTGDVIPVDGPDGTAKMNKDDLLRETAENAVNSGVAASRVNANNVELSDMGKANKIVSLAFDFGDWELGSVSSSGSDVASTTRIRTALIAGGASSKHIFVNIPSGYYLLMACTNTLYKVDWTNGEGVEFTIPRNQSVRFALKKSDESDLSLEIPNLVFAKSGVNCVGDDTKDLSDVLKMVEAATGKEIINPVATDSSLLSNIVFKRAKTWRYVNALQKRCYSLHTKNLGAKYHLSNEFLLHSYSSGNSFSINSNGEAVITSSSANAESSLHIGGFNPYYFYELDCDFGAGKTAGIEFPNEDFSDVIRVTCEGTAVRVVRIVSGVETELDTFTASETPERLYVHYNGLNVNISVGYGNIFAYLGYTACDMRDFADYKSRRFGVYAKLDASESITIKDVWGGISSGTGQADPVVCHRKNGEPYVKNGKLYLTMTFRGYENPMMSGACICTLDIDTYELEIIGHLYGVTAGDKLYHMTNSCFLYNDDEDAFYFFGLIFDLNNHYEYYAKLEEQDIGSSLYLQYTNLGLGANKESFDVVYDATLKKWTALYCDLADDYKTKLAYADELLGTYVVQASTTATNTTASRWVVVGSTKKAVMGGNLQTMAIYSDMLTYEGEMNVPEKLNGNRMWCTVVPVRVGNFTKYLMLSFDRGNFTGSYSYGTIGVFESDIIKKGSEYEYIG